MFFFVVFLFLLLTIRAQEVVEVPTQHGVIRGQVVSSPFGTEVEQFLGIPFAVPPIGSGRFGNPELYGEFPGGLFEAFEYGYKCVQPPPSFNASNTVEESEDCLNLNIWRPRPVEENRAVMIWVHGGSFIEGSGSDPMYVGDTLSSYGDVIVVTINYRLAVFGFFYTADERMENGNFGLLDIQMALRWVQENIAAFGGDPKQVTVFGQSAGAAGVAHLLTLPESEGLYNRVITQSGTSTAPLPTLLAVISTGQLSSQTGCPNDNSLLECLRDIPAEDLERDASSIIQQPVIDGIVIPDNPLNLIATGQVLRKDVLIGKIITARKRSLGQGFTKDEGSLLLFDVVANLTEEFIEEDPYGAFVYSATYLGTVLRNLDEDQLDDVIDIYEPTNISDPTAAKIAISNMVGDILFVCTCEEFASAVNDQGIEVYEYYLTYRWGSSDLAEWQGVTHSADLKWVWGILSFSNRTYEEQEEYFSMEIIDTWVNFAKYGYTNDNWLPYTGEGASYAELRGPGDFRYFYGESARGEKCALWLFNV